MSADPIAPQAEWAPYGRLLVSDRGGIIGPSGQTLRPRRNSKGYLNVTAGERPCPDPEMCKVARRALRHRHRRSEYVHRLVLLAFIGHPDPDGTDETVDWTGEHRNGDQLDNRIENLMWLPRPLNVNRFHPGWGSPGE